MILRDELSFLPEEYVHRKGRHRAICAGAAVVSLVVAGVGMTVFRAERAMLVVENRHAAVAREYADATQDFEGLRKQHELNRRVIQRAALASTLIERVPRSNILAELTNRLPQGASLLDLSLESRQRLEDVPVATTAFDMKKAALEAKRKAETVSLPQSTDLEVAIRLSGLAETDVQVAHYLSELGRSRLFHDVGLVMSEAYSLPGRKGATLRRFQIQMTVAADAEIKPRPGDAATRTATLEE